MRLPEVGKHVFSENAVCAWGEGAAKNDHNCTESFRFGIDLVWLQQTSLKKLKYRGGSEWEKESSGLSAHYAPISDEGLLWNVQ